MNQEYLQTSELESFYKQTGPEVYTYIEILSRDPELAADTVQAVFLRFIELTEEGKIRRNTAPQYVKRMARNELFQRFRQSRQTAPVEDLDRFRADNRQERVAELSEDIRTVLLEALDDPDLRPPLPEILRARFIKGLSVEEICATVKESRATVYRHMEKGLRFLATAFKQAGIELEDLHADN